MSRNITGLKKVKARMGYGQREGRKKNGREVIRKRRWKGNNGRSWAID